MLGIGLPYISPSPFAALCRGVPVILPYYGPDAVPTGWGAFSFKHWHQHAIAALEGPPYVYSVNLEGSVDELISAVKTAVETPIGKQYVSFVQLFYRIFANWFDSIPKDMTITALNARIRNYLRTDWENFALERRTAKELNGARLALPTFLSDWVEEDRLASLGQR